ncbi:amidohydrolase family protein [Streptomyces sp. NBC_01221]|uniref:amidohydrolase family protein n=1 Tax=Streptomyces sp. NBC_01221 TaxID=2903782 RepID=UPI002259615A|nr:amidohydrolase family protein [Streptomyces sp. NBC_01221]MCX4792305.1 amidohydrolase family protein [Streptomyces sp. NBC_01221]
MPTRREALAASAALTGGALLSAAPAAAAVPRVAPGRATAASGQRPGGAIALTHATVLGAGPDHTVLIRDGRITRTGRSAEVPIPRGTTTYDLTGKYIVPGGLVEAHVHNNGPESVLPPLFPLNGVTTVREMWGGPVHHEWRDKVRAGKLLGPRWVIASSIIDGRPSIWANDTGERVVEVTDTPSARRAVREAKASGADFVKVYSRLTPEAYEAIADESRRQGLRHAGHCPDTLPIARASDAGQQSIEHLHALLLAASARESEIRRAMAKVRIDPTLGTSFERYASWFRQVHAVEWQAMRTYDVGRTRALFDRLAANGTRVVPTLTVHHSLERTDQLTPNSSEFKYLPDWMTDYWPTIWSALTAGRTAQDSARIHQIYEHRLRLVAELHRAGVQLLAGTDTGTGYAVPGFSLHHELELLAEAGLPTRDVLRAATTAPARMLGLPADRADLLVLDANPRTDIRHTRRIDSVLVAGRYLDRAERLRLLADVARAAAASKPPGAAAPHICVH